MFKNNDIDPCFLKYKGPFGIQIISGFAKFLSDNMTGPENARKKLYHVFIELTQNIALYSAERALLLNNNEVGIGEVYIINQTNKFECITINKIQKEHAPVLIKNCNEINGASIQLLKDKKRNLHKLANSQDTGAHLGLIMIYTYSENPLKIEIIEKNGIETYFKITAVINK